jgi:hypothetical protein
VQQYSHFPVKRKLSTRDRCPVCDDIFIMQLAYLLKGSYVYITQKYHGYYVGSCLSLRKRYGDRELDSLVKVFPCEAWQRRIREQEIIEYLTFLHVPLTNKRRAFLEFHAFLRGTSWYHLPEDMQQFCKMLAHNTKQQGKE